MSLRPGLVKQRAEYHVNFHLGKDNSAQVGPTAHRTSCAHSSGARVPASSFSRIFSGVASQLGTAGPYQFPTHTYNPPAPKYDYSTQTQMSHFAESGLFKSPVVGFYDIQDRCTESERQPRPHSTCSRNSLCQASSSEELGAEFGKTKNQKLKMPILYFITVKRDS